MRERFGMASTAHTTEARNGVESGKQGSKRRRKKGKEGKQEAVEDEHKHGNGKKKPVDGVVAVGSNWERLKQEIGARGKKRKRKDQSEEKEEEEAKQPPTKLPRPLSGDFSETHIVALDCEMVGVGEGGVRSALARVSIVNYYGNVLLDTFVKVIEKVIDYRTQYSGVRPSDLRDAPTFHEVQKQVAKILEGKTVVGHALKNDFQVLLLKHPRSMMRDTARFKPLCVKRRDGSRGRPRPLRHLAKEYLGFQIQGGEHSSVDDARATLYLYHKFRQSWEKEMLVLSRKKKRRK